MRLAKVGAITAGLVVGGCIALIAWYFWLAGGEVQENRYAGYAEAQDSLRRGWLPRVLPRSAREIHEWHDLDTNLCVGSFRFDPGERSEIESSIRPGLRREIRIDRDPSFSSRLARDAGEEQLSRAGFEFYLERDFGLAINWTAGVVYFWNTPS